MFIVYYGVYHYTKRHCAVCRGALENGTFQLFQNQLGVKMINGSYVLSHYYYLHSTITNLKANLFYKTLKSLTLRPGTWLPILTVPALLTLAPLNDSTQIEMILLVLQRPWWPRQLMWYVHGIEMKEITDNNI
jgi:hypothetical protein